ncbi:hypothetical protein PIB30_101263, partial [Stylosanthes scabra]|nr:hypothetical protein [Stylosanthes scabra]
MEKGDNTKRKRIITLGNKEIKEKSAKEKRNSFEVTQVKSSSELLKLYNIKIEKTNAENNKASLQAQGRKEQHENISKDEEDEANGIMDPDKKGMSLDMYFKVHGINLDEEEDEEDEEEEEDENEGWLDPSFRGGYVFSKVLNEIE